MTTPTALDGGRATPSLAAASTDPDVAGIADIPVVPAILTVVAEITGPRLALVARKLRPFPADGLCGVDRLRGEARSAGEVRREGSARFLPLPSRTPSALPKQWHR